MPLEESDCANTPINGIPDSCLGFVGQSVDGVLPLVREELVQKLGHIAGPEDFVDIGKFLWLLRWEIRCKDATRQTFSP